MTRFTQASTRTQSGGYVPLPGTSDFARLPELAMEGRQMHPPADPMAVAIEAGQLPGKLQDLAEDLGG